MKLSIQSIEGIVQSLAVTLTEDIHVGQPNVCGNMLSCSWPSLLGSLSLLLSKSTSSTLSLQCVKSFVSLISTCSTLGHGSDAPRDALITALIKCAGGRIGSEDASGSGPKPEDLSTPMSDKEIMCANGLLTVARTSGDLGGSSWYLLLSLLLALERKFLASSSSSGDSESAATDILTPEVADLILNDSWPPRQAGNGVSEHNSRDVLRVSMRGLFRDTRNMKDEELVTFVTELTKLSNSAVHCAFYSTGIKVYPAHRLCETLLWNAKRAHKVWPLVAGHLKAVASHPAASVRSECLTAITTVCVSSLVKAPKNEELRGEILQCLLSLSVSGHADTREVALGCVGEIIRANGPVLGQGWSVALQVVNNTASCGRRAGVASGFELLRYIIEEMLVDIPIGYPLLRCISVIGSYALQDQDSNASLSTPNLFWSLAHYIAQITTASAEDVRNMWTEMLKCIAAASADKTREEVRAGGLRTLFKMMEMYGEMWSDDLWTDTSQGVIVPLLRDITTLAVRALGKNMAPASWALTVSLTLGAVPLLLRSIPSDKASVLESSVALAQGVICASQPYSADSVLAGRAEAIRDSKPLKDMLYSSIDCIALLLEDESCKQKEFCDLMRECVFVCGKAIIERATKESQHLQNLKSTALSSTSRFNQYFVLVQFIKKVLNPPEHYSSSEDVDNSIALVLQIVRAGGGSLFLDSLYKTCGVFFEPQYPKLSTAPLIYYMSVLAEETLIPKANLGGPQLKDLIVAFSLLSSLCVDNIMTQHLSDNDTLPLGDTCELPPDPPNPIPISQYKLNASLLGVNCLLNIFRDFAIEVKGTASSMSTVPLLMYVLGCLMSVRYANPLPNPEKFEDSRKLLWGSACEAYVCVVKCTSQDLFALDKRATVSIMIDVAEHYLLANTALEDCDEKPHASESECISMLSQELLSQRSIDALIHCSGVTNTKRPTVSSGCLSSLFTLIPTHPLVASSVIKHSRDTLTNHAHSSSDLLRKLLSLSLSRSKWPKDAVESLPPIVNGMDNGKTHLLLVFRQLLELMLVPDISLDLKKMASKAIILASEQMGLVGEK